MKDHILLCFSHLLVTYSSVKLNQHEVNIRLRAFSGQFDTPGRSDSGVREYHPTPKQRVAGTSFVCRTCLSQILFLLL